jgi:hypothetical protein
MKLFVAILAAIVLAPAAVNAASYSREQLCMILQPCEPPRAFASGPFVAEPVIIEVTLRQIQQRCGSASENIVAADTIMGCALLEPTRCVVHVPKDVKAAIPELYDVVLRHELAHCRGWVHAHY